MMNFPGATKTILALLLMGCIHPVGANNWYQVEVIIFAYLNPNVDGEQWLSQPGIPAYKAIVELVSADAAAEKQVTIAAQEAARVPAAQAQTPTPGAALSSEDKPVAFLELPKQSQRLQGVYRVLRLSRDYRPLQHISWQQPALGTARARAVHLNLYEAARDLIEELPPELAEIQIPEEVAQIEEPGAPVFDGFIRVRSASFLHIDIDINYFPAAFKADEPLASRDESATPEGEDSEAKPQPPPVQAVEYVRLRESRKIRLNELHYFDHPLFGVIVQVSRLEFETEESTRQ